MKGFTTFEEFLALFNEELQNLRFNANPRNQRPDIICLGHDQDLAALPCESTIH